MVSESPLVGGGGGHRVTSGVQGAPCGCWPRVPVTSPEPRGMDLVSGNFPALPPQRQGVCVATDVGTAFSPWPCILATGGPGLHSAREGLCGCKSVALPLWSSVPSSVLMGIQPEVL